MKKVKKFLLSVKITFKETIKYKSLYLKFLTELIPTKSILSKINSIKVESNMHVKDLHLLVIIVF